MSGGDVASAVRRVVVHDDELVVRAQLWQQGSEEVRQGCGLVTRRDHDRHGRAVA
jgi:hypothetical protein